MKVYKLVDKQALRDWDQYKKDVHNSTFVDHTETTEQKRKRIKMLEADQEKWIKYYFPKFAIAEPAKFHKDATKRLLENDRWYEVRAWSRELAKSTRAMMETLYMTLTGRRFNVLLVSNSSDNAQRLLLPYKINLESNQRIINDYGKQQALGQWDASEFTTKKGVSFRAIGAGQSPRGSRNEEKRVDVILVDDIDTDEDCRNPRIIKEKWKWVEEALIPTVSVSGKYTILFLGNIIAKYCCITQASKKAKKTDIVNIRDANGRSSWKEKNSEKDIDEFLSILSYSAQQKECFNNPVTEGTIFKEMHYKHMRPLKEYKFLVCYTDPSYKSTSKNDYKAVVLVGYWKGEYHIIKAFVRQCTTAAMVDAMIEMKQFVGSQTAVYYYMEEVFLQDIIKKEVYEIATKKNVSIPLTGDTRKKPDKFHRIESNLEPLNTNGKLFLNESEEDNPDMQVLEEQFIAMEQGMKTHDDAPDAVEGAKWIIDSKLTETDPAKIGKRQPSKKRL